MIEPATRFHAPALAAIHRQAFAAPDAWSEAALATQLQSPGGYGVVDGAGGFALARVIVDQAELLTLAVLPALRRRGLGRALLQAVREGAAARGATELLLEVSEANGDARALYAAAGFQPVGRRVGYYPGGTDALVLRLSDLTD